jgi:hypothetical protein
MEPEALDGVEFPWEMMFSKDAIKRAVREALGGAEVQDVTLHPEVQTWKRGSAVLVHYVLTNGSKGMAKFVVFVMPAEDTLTVHFEAQTIPGENPS